MDGAWIVTLVVVAFVAGAAVILIRQYIREELK